MRAVGSRWLLVLVTLLLVACGKVPEDYACMPTDDVGYKREAICHRWGCVDRLVKVKRYTCTNGRDEWIKAE